MKEQPNIPEALTDCPNCGTELQTDEQGNQICPQGDYPEIDWGLGEEIE